MLAASGPTLGTMAKTVPFSGGQSGWSCSSPGSESAWTPATRSVSRCPTRSWGCPRAGDLAETLSPLPAHARRTSSTVRALTPARGVEHGDACALRRPHAGIAPAEQRHGGTAGRRGQVRDPRIAADIQPAPRQARRQLGEREGPPHLSAEQGLEARLCQAEDPGLRYKAFRNMLAPP